MTPSSSRESLPTPGGAWGGSGDGRGQRHARDRFRRDRDHDPLIAVSPTRFPAGNDGRLVSTSSESRCGGVCFISGVVALTLTPMLSAKILRCRHSMDAFTGRSRADSTGWRWLRAHACARIRLRWCGGHRDVIVLLSVFSFPRVEREFVPSEDRGFFVTLFVVAPEGASAGLHR